MAKTAGRLCVIQKNSVTIAGGRNVNISVNGSPIEVGDQGSSGFTEKLADELTGRELQFTLDGVEEDQVIRDIAFGSSASGHFMDDLTFVFPNGDSISGDFVLSGYSETGAYEDAQTFNATFTSNGQWTYAQAV